jgi:hypothetical protein
LEAWKLHGLIGSVETSWIDTCLSDQPIIASEERRSDRQVPWDANEVASVMLGISPWLCPETLFLRLEARAELGKFQEAIGATFASNLPYLVKDASESELVEPDDCNDPDEIEDLFANAMQDIDEGRIDLDSVMASETSAMPRKDIFVQDLENRLGECTENVGCNNSTQSSHTESDTDSKLLNK